jgi:adenosylcobinamide-phosphate synthase
VNALGAAGGAALDQIIGEPFARGHPVAAYGTLMQRLETRCYRNRRANGVALAAAGAGLAVGVGFGLRRLVGPTAATVIATAVCVAGKMLDGEAQRVGASLRRGDLDAARGQVRSLVGRNTAELDDSEISRAVIESVAENCVDAVTASLFWAALGGAPAVLAHRAINTLDAMVGHHDERYEHFGWASARLDDLVNYIPARLTALAVIAVRPRTAIRIGQIVRRDAGRHPSPNGGVVEAAFAAALGVTLGGVNRYGDEVEDRGTLGDGRSPTPADIAGAVRLRRQATAVVALVLLAVDGGRQLAATRRRR